MQNKEQLKNPKGVLILGVLIVIFGLLSLVNYFTLDHNSYRDSLKRIGQNEISSQIKKDQIKIANQISLIISAFLLSSGIGILYRKELARKVMVWFSVFVVILFILAAVIQPASIIFAFPQFLFFSIVILYFTNKNIKDFFLRKKVNNQKI
ncbi:MAG: hypothetical protein K9L84_01380 [Candidatus Omnitrophica bacterium]|nr:hypothetical protein [Candidatus Omnitrophota bacterium]MCF7893701.1 hypothetical protein [Candidatus Omnitrophota bacterium]